MFLLLLLLLLFSSKLSEAYQLIVNEQINKWTNTPSTKIIFNKMTVVSVGLLKSETVYSKKQNKKKDN